MDFLTAMMLRPSPKSCPTNLAGNCRLAAEILLDEIGQSPGTLDTKSKPESHGVSSVVVAEREGYSLAAGMALGLVCLGHGSRALGLSDMHIESRLR